KSYISEPEVTVIVQQINSQKFNILGQVTKPGFYSLVNSPTVLDAIAMAGGFRDFAKKKSIYVLRQNPDGTTTRLPFNYKDVIQGKNATQNVKLQPHDNVSPSGGRPISDFSYSVWPFITLDQMRSRLSWNLSYSPGFTFYQKTTAFNESDHNLALALKYRLSPHVTFKVENRFSKTSNFLNQNQNLAAEPATGLAPTVALVVP